MGRNLLWDGNPGTVTSLSVSVHIFPATKLPRHPGQVSWIDFVTEFVTRIRDQTGVALWENGDREASIHAFRGRPAFPEEVTEPKTK
jgi:hypothetical protein